MITEDYVLFETAKLLKEKEFNERCRDFYRQENGNWLQRNTYEYNYFNLQMPIWEGCYTCPTLQMTLKWLREVHKFDIDVSIEYKNSKKVYYYSILKKTAIRNIDCLHSETNFDSYEQAVEAAIKYCLTSLI